MNDLSHWTPVLYNETAPPFVIHMDTWQVRQFQKLAALPFSQSLQIVIASVPQLEHQHWHEFQQVAQRHVPENRLAIWQRIGDTMRRILPDVWDLLTRYPFQQAVNCALERLRKGNEVDQFAFLACLYYFQQDNVTAQMLLTYLLQHVDQDSLNMQAVLTFFQQLTTRQRDVIQLTAFGFTNREIAHQLCVQPSVVAEHLTTIYAEFSAALNLVTDTHGIRYRLIHWMTRLYQKHPELVINMQS